MLVEKTDTVIHGNGGDDHITHPPKTQKEKMENANDKKER